MNIRSTALAAAMLAALLGGTAHAALVTLRGDIVAADVLRWNSSHGGNLFVTNSDGGIQATVFSARFEMGTVIQAGPGCGSYPANFAPCEIALRNTAAGQGLVNPIFMEFSTPLSGVGTQFGIGDRWGAFTAVVSVFDALGNLLESHTRDGDTQFTFDDTAIFLGVQRATADIAALRFDVLSYGVPASNPNFFSDNFLINQVQLSTATTSTTVPEPGSLALAALAGLALVGARRRC